MSNCPLLTSVEWGDDPSITSIGNDCFSYTGLTSFRIPRKLQYIGGACFFADQIISFIVDSENDYFSSDQGVLFDKDKSRIEFCSVAMNGSFEIPGTVQTIAQVEHFEEESCHTVIQKLLNVWVKKIN